MQAFATLLVAKIAEAAGANSNVVDTLKVQAFIWSATSFKHAEAAANRIYNELSDDWLTSPCNGCSNNELIHLIGHSRGGAVNARVSRLLIEAGYNVDQVTVLDGFSSDWPDDGGLIGDISISGETMVRTNHSTLPDGRKVNYRIELPLNQYILGILGLGKESVVMTMIRNYTRELGLFASINSSLIDTALLGLNQLVTAANTAANLDLLDLRAPSRASFGFEDEIFSSVGLFVDLSAKCQDGLGGSHHLNITNCYVFSGEDDLAIPTFESPYIYDNYVGQNR